MVARTAALDRGKRRFDVKEPAFLYAALVTLLHAVGVPRGAVSLYNIIVNPLVSGHGLSYNLPMWFIAPLFFAEVAYAFLGRLFNRGGTFSIFV